MADMNLGNYNKKSNSEAESSKNSRDQSSSATGSFKAINSGAIKNSNTFKPSTFGNSNAIEKLEIQSLSSRFQTLRTSFVVNNQDSNIPGNKSIVDSQLFTFGCTNQNKSECDSMPPFKSVTLNKDIEMKNPKANSAHNPENRSAEDNSKPSESFTFSNSKVLDKSGMQSLFTSDDTVGGTFGLKNEESNIPENKSISDSQLQTLHGMDKEKSEIDLMSDITLDNNTKRNNPEVKSSKDSRDNSSLGTETFNAINSGPLKNSNPSVAFTFGTSFVEKNQESNIAGNKSMTDLQLFAFGCTDKNNSECDSMPPFRSVTLNKDNRMKIPKAKSTYNTQDKSFSASGSFNATQSGAKENSKSSESSTFGNCKVLDTSGIQSLFNSGDNTFGSNLGLKNRESNIPENKSISDSQLHALGGMDKEKSEMDLMSDITLDNNTKRNHPVVKSSKDSRDKSSPATAPVNAINSGAIKNSNPFEIFTFGNGNAIDKSRIQSVNPSGVFTFGTSFVEKNQESNKAGKKSITDSQLFTFGCTDKNNSECDSMPPSRSVTSNKDNGIKNPKAKSTYNTQDKSFSASGSFNATQSGAKENSKPPENSTIGNREELDKSGIQSSCNSRNDTFGSTLGLKNKESNIAGNKSMTDSPLFTFCCTNRNDPEWDSMPPFRSVTSNKDNGMKNPKANSAHNHENKSFFASGSFNATQWSAKENSKPSESSTFGNSKVLDTSGIQSLFNSADNTFGSNLGLKNRESNIPGNKSISDSQLRALGGMDKEKPEMDLMSDITLDNNTKRNNPEVKSSKDSRDKSSPATGTFNAINSGAIKNSNPSVAFPFGTSFVEKNQESNIAGNKSITDSQLFTFGCTDKNNSECDSMPHSRSVTSNKDNGMKNRKVKSTYNTQDKSFSASGSFNATQSGAKENSKSSESSTFGNSKVLDTSGIQSLFNSGDNTFGSNLGLKNRESNIPGNKSISDSQVHALGGMDKEKSEMDLMFDIILDNNTKRNNPVVKSSKDSRDKSSPATAPVNAINSGAIKNSNPFEISTFGNGNTIDKSRIQSVNPSGVFTFGISFVEKNQESSIAGNKSITDSQLFTFGCTDKNNSECDSMPPPRSVTSNKDNRIKNPKANSAHNHENKSFFASGSFNATQLSAKENSRPSESFTFGNSKVLEKTGIQYLFTLGDDTFGGTLGLKNRESNIPGNKSISDSQLHALGGIDKEKSEMDLMSDITLDNNTKRNNPVVKSSKDSREKSSPATAPVNAINSGAIKNSNPFEIFTFGNGNAIDKSRIQSVNPSGVFTFGTSFVEKNQESNKAGKKSITDSQLFTFGCTDKNNSECDSMPPSRSVTSNKDNRMKNPKAKSSYNTEGKSFPAFGSFNATQSGAKENSKPPENSTIGNNKVLDKSGLQSLFNSADDTFGDILVMKNQESNKPQNKSIIDSQLFTFGCTDKNNSACDSMPPFRSVTFNNDNERKNPKTKTSNNPEDKSISSTGSFNATQIGAKRNSRPSKTSTFDYSEVFDKSGIQSDNVNKTENPEVKSSYNSVDKSSSDSGSFNAIKSCKRDKIGAGNIPPNTLVVDDESKDKKQIKHELKPYSGTKLFQSVSSHDIRIKENKEMWDKSSIDNENLPTSSGINTTKKTETVMNKPSSGHTKLVSDWKGCENTMKQIVKASTPRRELLPNATREVSGLPLDSPFRDALDESQDTIYKRNPEKDGNASRVQDLFKDQLLRHQIKHMQNETNKDAGNLNSRIILTPEELVKIISYYPTFSVKISDLKTLEGIRPASAHYIASLHSHIFNLSKEVIKLEPQLTLCLNHLLETGCQIPSRCNKIHICPAYISGTCKEKSCYLGHSWLTDHNLLILEYFCVAKLSPLQLSKLFESLANTDKSIDSLEICDQYNKNVCTKTDCTELHICLDFVLGITKCKKEICFRNHDILDAQCKNILKAKCISTNQAARDIVLALHKAIPSLKEKMNCSSFNNLYPKQPRTCWSHYFEGNVSIPEICYYSVESQCNKEESGCPRLHAANHFHWQIKREDTWYNLMLKQSLVLERSFCDVVQDGIDFQKFNLQSSDDSSVSELVAFMKQDVWHADFKTMTLVNSSSTQTLPIRRLCTEYIPGKVIKASKFSWYFFDQNNIWVRYGDYDTHLHCLSGISSDDIEKQYIENPTATLLFSTSIYSYILDFKTMQQTNQTTKVSREVRRRPIPYLLGEKELPSIWNVMPQGKRLLRVSLSHLSTEYQEVLNLLKGKIFESQIKRIERIQNPFVWCAFQNKLKEMTAIYGNTSKVNVRQLFHGTKSDVVESICLENFDWRLHGSNAGQVYGQGTYFSSDVMFSYGYCQPDSTGVKYLFIAKVIVGLVTVGKSSMTRPPKDQVTGVNFDSTADCVPNFKILVKYDKQEYYPEYVISLT